MFVAVAVQQQVLERQVELELDFHVAEVHTDIRPGGGSRSLSV